MRFKKPCVPFVLLVVVIFLFIFSTLGCTQPNQEGASAVRSFLTVCKKANTANEFSALTDTITLDQKRVTDGSDHSPYKWNQLPGGTSYSSVTCNVSVLELK